MPGDAPPERDGYSYPLYRKNERKLPPAYDGPIYLWDIDNTYLHTDFAGFRDLLRIRFESAEDKRPVPGAVELMAGLRRVEVQGERPPLYFVSASPDSMRGVLERRMLIDGVVHDGITFRNLRRLRYLRDIFGYKLAALLLYRLENPPHGKELLFGDDREHDPWIYELYARTCSGACRGASLDSELAARGVRTSARKYIVTLADELPQRDVVHWILIRKTGAKLDRLQLLEEARLVATDDYAQAAALLRALGLIPADDLRKVLAAVEAAGGAKEPLRAVREHASRLEPGAAEGVERELAGAAG